VWPIQALIVPNGCVFYCANGRVMASESTAQPVANDRQPMFVLHDVIRRSVAGGAFALDAQVCMAWTQ